jgi:hypothetical protein
MNPRRLFTGVVAFFVFEAAWLPGHDRKPTDKADTKATRTLPTGWSRLKLTKEQKEKVHVIRDSYKAKIDELQKQIKDLRGQEKDELLKVLTTAQKKRLEEIAPSKPAGDKSKDDGERERAKDPNKR